MNCEIIIPVWNQIAFTKDCIDSIVANTEGVDFGIAVIDNGSDDQTRRYLEGLKGGGSPYRLIRNEKNAGFIKAVNEGVRTSGAKHVCILNNDTLVSKDWLKFMIDVADSRKDIGIVNPSSNNLGQRPAGGEPIESYAARLRVEAGKYVELGAAIGFCMLIKREVIDKIGLFDEVYGMGNFEDTDYSRRAVKEGFMCVRSSAAYVYHRESSSFSKVKTFDEDFRRNRDIFEFRWGKPKRLAYIIEGIDRNTLMKVSQDSARMARSGNWVWFFSGSKIELPDHSNIICKIDISRYSLAKALFNIVKKKKRFDEIFVGNERTAGLLKALAFIHRAHIGYY